jgi:hypothetical protein
MANNRMFILCLRCLNDETTPIEDCRLYTGKYYPSDGWNFNSEHVEEFFSKHRHADTWEMGMFGDHFTLATESLFRSSDSFVDVKRCVLEAVKKGMDEGRIGK